MPGVGNDVVDLKEPENKGKSGNDRFLSRVFTDEERELIARAAAPDTLLWSLWAAKEAAYKAVSGGDPSLGSIPRRYPVLLDGDSAAGTKAAVAGADGRLTGRVLTPRGEMALRITVTEDYVHALVAGSDADFVRIIQQVHRMDEVGKSDNPSALVRWQLLAEISRRLDCLLDDLTIRNDPPLSGAPRLFLRDRPLAAEISLSHDGRFAAFALLMSVTF